MSVKAVFETRGNVYPEIFSKDGELQELIIYSDGKRYFRDVLDFKGECKEICAVLKNALSNWPAGILRDKGVFTLNIDFRGERAETQAFLENMLARWPNDSLGNKDYFDINFCFSGESKGTRSFIKNIISNFPSDMDDNAILSIWLEISLWTDDAIEEVLLSSS